MWRDGWYVVPYTVPWRDLDGLAHVNNAVYLSYFELGRTRYWLDLRKNSELGPRAVEFIVARAECDFKLQLAFNEEIEIRTRIGEMRNSSFDFLCEIHSKAGIAATGRVVVVLFDWVKNAKKMLGPELREAIERFQQEG